MLIETVRPYVNRSGPLDRSHRVLQHVTCHGKSDFAPFHAREPIVDTSKHTGIVDFEKCLRKARERAPNARHSLGIDQEAMWSPNIFDSTLTAAPLTVECPERSKQNLPANSFRNTFSAEVII